MSEHISFSQLNMLLRCGAQFERRYVKGEKIAPSGSLVRGRSAHKAAEKNFRQKIETRIDLPTEAVKDFFSDEWEQNKYEISWTPEELGGETPGTLEGKYKDQGVSLVETYHTQLAPLAVPEAVEDPFTVHFEGGYSDLVGIIDRIDMDGTITDMKFVSKSPSADDAASDIQITCYDLGYRQTRKKKPFRLRKEYAIATKVPKTITQEVPPREDDMIERFLFRLEKAMEVIEKGVFQPAPIGAWWCSPKFCGYWNTCRYHP